MGCLLAAIRNNRLIAQTSSPEQPKQYTLELENEGRLTLPDEVLRQLDLKQYDSLRDSYASCS